MFTHDKLKKLHRILTSKIGNATKKLSLNLKIKKGRETTYNKKNVNNKYIKMNDKKKNNNQNKIFTSKQKKTDDKSFQNNISILSEIAKKEDNLNDTFASYLTDNNFHQKNKIKNVTIIKSKTRELYDKTLFFHIMKYYITKSENNLIKLDNLYYFLKPMKSYITNSKRINSNNNSNEKRKYILYDDNFNLTFGKEINNDIGITELKKNNINREKIENLNLMNNQIFNNNFIFNINNYRSNIQSTKNKIFKDIINQENTPSFHDENKDVNIKISNKKNQPKKVKSQKNYLNIEEFKLNNHILQNLLYKKKALENSKAKLDNKPNNINQETPRTKSFSHKKSLIEEINKRVKNKYNKNRTKKIK